MLWEYHRLSVDGPNVENALQNLGQEGWELVAVIPETRIFFGFQCFFKRPIATNTPQQPQPPERNTEAKRLDPYSSVRTNPLGRSSREGDSHSPESLARLSWKR
ncbi:hypothetical protein V5E97_12910 [Singulisphaera sp. Ch08]|uniref:DUF4177 domain-containing protein n=1 Tax=Singulisphaera sp. Ch08 TaxID=3120278 RepID=A0AAU7CPP9_9BACT